MGLKNVEEFGGGSFEGGSSLRLTRFWEQYGGSGSVSGDM
jgi:hypothetical protein